MAVRLTRGSSTRPRVSKREREGLPPDSDSAALADLLLNCWEGAALRSRLRRDPAPLDDLLDFFFDRYDLRIQSTDARTCTWSAADHQP
jgi:hypothetical protein